MYRTYEAEAMQVFLGCEKNRGFYRLQFIENPGSYSLGSTVAKGFAMENENKHFLLDKFRYR